MFAGDAQAGSCVSDKVQQRTVRLLEASPVTATIGINCPLYTTPGAPDQDQKFIDIRMNAIRRKIIILSGKGGMSVLRVC